MIRCCVSKPVAEAEPEAFAPDVDSCGVVPQHHHDVDFGARLVGGVSMQYCGAVPEAGSTTAAGGRSTTLIHGSGRDRRRDVGRTLHQMAAILVDAMHRKGPQHQSRLADALIDGEIGLAAGEQSP